MEKLLGDRHVSDGRGAYRILEENLLEAAPWKIRKEMRRRC
jgi:hypothetical protein